MKRLSLCIAVLSLLSASASAQCRTFTKRNCLPVLEGYAQNDNYNSAVLIAGDEAELSVTFLPSTEYRVAVCAHPVLGDVTFDILDQQGIRIWSNSKGEDHVDFSLQHAQRLRFRIQVPDTDAAILHEGCVSLLVGSKD
ncbi:MAG: hypothetical protein CL835_01865 [Crocinitomicaceae bacterium]|nr:hypothetical protein [Crocinitomicaceae bacterium]